MRGFEGCDVPQLVQHVNVPYKSSGSPVQDSEWKLPFFAEKVISVGNDTLFRSLPLALSEQ